MLQRRHVMMGALAGLGSLSSAANAAQPKASSNLLKTLTDLELKSWDNTIQVNVEAMEKYFSDDVVLIMGNGIRYSKAEYIASTKVSSTSDVNCGKMTLLQMAPDVASVIYSAKYMSSAENEPKIANSVTSVGTYVRRGQDWLQILYQETPVS